MQAHRGGHPGLGKLCAACGPSLHLQHSKGRLHCWPTRGEWQELEKRFTAVEAKCDSSARSIKEAGHMDRMFRILCFVFCRSPRPRRCLTFDCDQELLERMAALEAKVEACIIRMSDLACGLR